MPQEHGAGTEKLTCSGTECAAGVTPAFGGHEAHGDMKSPGGTLRPHVSTGPEQNALSRMFLAFL